MSYKNNVCEQASKIISGERQGQYGYPEDSFAVIAKLWNVYLDARDTKDSEGHWIHDPIVSTDVAVMMALMKIARISNGVFKEDSYVDAIGYLAIAAELDQESDIKRKFVKYIHGRMKQKLDEEDEANDCELTTGEDISSEAIENWRRHQKECSDSCSIDIPGGDPDEVNDGAEEEEENQVKDCNHCFYFNKKYDGCLRGEHIIKEIDCKYFKDRTSCLTCAHSDYEVIHDDGELRVLCKLDDEYHSNTRACKNWEEGEV